LIAPLLSCPRQLASQPDGALPYAAPKRWWLFASKNRRTNDLVLQKNVPCPPQIFGGLDRTSFNGSINGTYFSY
jgi:hypothetical protein